MRDIQEFNPYVTYVNHGELRPGMMIDERMVMWYELEFITDCGPGVGCVTLDQFIPIQKGSLFFRHPGDVVRGVPPYSYTGILFDTFRDPDMEPYYAIGARCMLSLIDLVFLRLLTRHDRGFRFLADIPPHICVRDFGAFHKPFLESAALFAGQGEDYQFYAKALLYQLLALTRREAGAGALIMREHSAAVTDARSFMEANYMRPITLGTLARRASMSREHFCRLFKRHVGVTPIQYLTSLRMFHAKHLLVMNKEPMEVIAARCGYQNVNYFYMAFRKNTGVTPTDYKKGASVDEAPVRR
jgi:AraC-like DNA-binding protein